MRLPLASLWAPLMVDSHDAATAPTLFAFKNEDGSSQASPTSQQLACRASPRGAPTSRRGGLQPAAVVPTARPGTSSRWGPSVVGMQESLGTSAQSFSSALGGQADGDGGEEDVRLQFGEVGRPTVLIRNFKTAAAMAARLPQHAVPADQGGNSRALIATSARRSQPALPRNGAPAPPTLASSRATQVADGAARGDTGVSMLSHLKGLMDALDSGSGTAPLPQVPGGSLFLTQNNSGKPKHSTPISQQQKKQSGGRAAPSGGQYGSRGPTGSLAQSLRDRAHWAAAAAAANAELQASFEAPRVAMWAHVPGSKVYEGLFPAYTLPSGSGAFMYRCGAGY